MNGENKSPLEINDHTLNEYEEKILPITSMPGDNNEFQDYISYDAAKLRSLTSYQCAIIATRLSQFAIYIQRCYNRNKGRIRFLEGEIKRIVASKSHLFAGRWEHQTQQAIDADDYARKCNQDLLIVCQRNDRLEHLCLSIKDMAEKYKNLQYSKIQEKKLDN